MISMRPQSSIVLAVACIVALAGVGIFAAAKSPREPIAEPALARARAAPDTTAGLGTARSRAPLDRAVDDAMRALDLVRPQPRPAIDFTLATVDQTRWRLADQRGKVVLLNFWATWCPPCLEEMPAMERLWRRYRAQDFAFVAVSVDTDPTLVPAFLKQHGLTFPVALDQDMEVSERYGVRALPSSFVIDRDGLLVGIAIGPRHWDNSSSRSLVEAMVHQ